MLNAIKHLLGGRVAEQLTLDDISTGASNDIMRATEIARGMVTKYGFSEKIGPVNYSDSDEVFLGKDFSTRKNFSEGVAAEIDHEVKAIIEDAYAETVKILEENMDKLERVAQALLEVETLDGEQFEALYTGEVDAEGLAQQVREKDEEIRKINAEEAAEYERIRKEEEEKLAEELAKYDTDYLDDDGDETAEETAEAESGAEEKDGAGAESDDTGVQQEAAEEAPNPIPRKVKITLRAERENKLLVKITEKEEE